MQRTIPAVFDDLGIGITLHDPGTGEILGVNERLEELYGYTEAELAEMAVGDYSVAGSGFTQNEAIQRVRAAAAGDPQSFDWHVERADGDRVWVSVKLARSTLDGEDYVVAEIRDITERKEREQALRDERAFSESIMEAIPDVFYAFDEYGQFEAWNDRLCEVTGYTDEEIAAMTPPEFFSETERPRITDTIATIIETEQSQRVESEYLTKDGERVPHEFSGGPFYDADGSMAGIAGVGRDITERKARERELERSNERLQQYASVLSHDLQEPLRMVSSFVDMLETALEDDLDEETREYMDYATDGADRMQAMIDGLLDYSRVESRGDEFVETDVGAVLADVRQDLDLKLREADVDLVVAEDRPTVTADTQQLGQLFRNLVKNAVEHGGPGTTVEVDCETLPDGHRFAVSDDGPGIPADRQDAIFGLFDRGEDSDGTGMGLAICERIVERHGGTIWVESTPGEGTTFYVTLESV